jgi:arylsulfatase A-like enzyme
MAGALVLPTLGCSEPRIEPRLVMLYVPCTVTKAHLSPYNADVSYTPNLDRFAKDSIVFARHQTEAGQSVIAYASILTGSQADHHGVYSYPIKLQDDLYLISEAYADNGYETFFWNGHGLTASALNYDQGVREENQFEHHLTAQDPRFLEILQRLRDDETYKAFIFTNLTVTHSRYRLDNLERFRSEHPAEAAGISGKDVRKYTKLYLQNDFALSWNFPRAVERLGLAEADIAKLSDVLELAFKSNVNELDRLFGEILQKVGDQGLLDRSLIVFSADHGEVLYRDNSPFQWSHSMQLAPEVLSVPLMVRLPEAESGAYDKVTRSIDVFPTMLGLSGIPAPLERGVQGVDLAPAFARPDQAPDLRAYSHTASLIPSVFESMQSEQWAENWGVARKFFPNLDVDLIWVSMRDGDTVSKLRNLDGSNWGFEIFDLMSDPEERANLYDPEKPGHAEIAEELTRYKQHLLSSFKRSGDETRDGALPTHEGIEALRGLGYVE